MEPVSPDNGSELVEAVGEGNGFSLRRKLAEDKSEVGLTDNASGTSFGSRFILYVVELDQLKGNIITVLVCRVMFDGAVDDVGNELRFEVQSGDSAVVCFCDDRFDGMLNT